MTDETKNPGEIKLDQSQLEAIKALNDPRGTITIPKDWRKGATFTRGTPIEKLPMDAPAYILYADMAAKINELIDAINKMNEL